MEKRTDYRAEFNALEERSRKELHRALTEWGGMFVWDADGQCPCITACRKWGAFVNHYVYKAVACDGSDAVMLYGYPADGVRSEDEDDDLLDETDFCAYAACLDLLPEPDWEFVVEHLHDYGHDDEVSESSDLGCYVEGLTENSRYEEYEAAYNGDKQRAAADLEALDCGIFRRAVEDYETELYGERSYE